jgi:hypothetical protein
MIKPSSRLAWKGTQPANGTHNSQREPIAHTALDGEKLQDFPLRWDKEGMPFPKTLTCHWALRKEA